MMIFHGQHTTIRVETPKGMTAFQVREPGVLADDRDVAAVYMRQVCKDVGMPYEDGMADRLQAYIQEWLG